ncbi:hypothetical protein ABFS82_08G020900 [Erythranthe guttata]|uniref:DUF4005 domain-containing protein n=1 Tax=Erythranthe guttata TaxID=4155 RepID=A0A022R071_ERYGU|nr:PREDICTED: protein IQ-DOMAIN 31-like [Erythranthe guttata]XP_012841377.1 PREDICTED: protein IQ-DOMAIN 31-like [Erythranthe guttata]EYU34101.1 hypothetical protein MIMGU_mgv1a003748mg [Erythranthe guttata]EYU34102.1 hypothetical protein MIMGU_mgv1a003748mg [Erythranthe guttata]|eukprot:XP_012841376.1 PREDICTED: protein IQ-DOMAIN 31-like [Erythranthe guttata]
MGKSAGKWIKTVLFGKKYSKSNFSKNVTPDKRTGQKTPAEDLPGNSPVISDPHPRQITERDMENLELEKATSGSPCDAIALSPVNLQNSNSAVAVSDAEMTKQEEAATKAQAAFRGYLARRAFRALKGIIRLQALIRGHLVRRQAVATLRCMHAIVKFQALARGRKVRLSDATPETQNKYNVVALQVAKKLNVGANLIFGSEKLTTNTFVRKLLVILPTAMPLSLQYDPAEPNSAWNWLERWSISRFWDPPVRTKKITKPKTQRKQGGGPQAVDTEAGKSKRTFRKVSTGENGALASSETDKPKRNPRKVPSNLTEPAQDQPQNELERVKRSLRRVSSSAATEKPETKPETEIEKPQPQPLPSVEVATNLEEVISSENPADSDAVLDKVDMLEAPPKQITHEGDDVALDDNHHQVLEKTPSLENGAKIETALTSEDALSCKEEQSGGKENHKVRKRRSLPAKQEYTENISQNSPSLPSYMLATESAKAKLKAQGSLKFGEEGAEYGNNNARRHSLPASTANGKLTSLSPRIQKPVQGNNSTKGVSKINKSLTTSRDDKGLYPGWRR